MTKSDARALWFLRMHYSIERCCYHWWNLRYGYKFRKVTWGGWRR